MHEEMDLNGLWELRDSVLGAGYATARAFLTEHDGWIDQPVPGDIHQGLVAAGRIEPPLIGLNSFDCAWTESRSWWFRRRFDLDAAWLEADVIELALNGLDANAEVFLNGVHIGSHPSAFRPFVLDVKPRLVAGQNMLLVRLSAGLETVSELDVDHCNGVRASTEANNGRPERGDPRRIFARKPQYSWGWDWSPRLATTAIGGDVTLRAMDAACVRDVALVPRRDGDAVLVTATITVDQFHYTQTRRGRVGVTMTDADGHICTAARDVLLRSGVNYVQLELRIDDPQLWWPAGLGDQHRYQVQTDVEVEGTSVPGVSLDYGLRFVELEAVDDFAFVINGRKVFAKGANWIPADTVYASVTADRYRTLVHEARESNFNMLRVWGGGLYEPEAFYDACDREGLMVWHDFMFGCAPYPDDLEAFRSEVATEADYQTKRLRRHASIVLWCGNNENTWGFVDWWGEQTQGGAHLYNYLLPQIVHRNCPEIPYWTSSPYGGERPNDADTGDQHFWGFAMMHPEMEKRITPEVYDTCTSRFVSEFGYIGAPVKETVLAYLNGAPFDRGGEVWQHHTNTFEKNTVDAGIRKHYTDPDRLSPDDYLLYSGLTQGLMYGYALDAMRLRSDCHGSLFWMFADCWGEVGWTIVDAYLRRKPAWYFVRRAYSPIRMMARSAGEDGVRVIVANGTTAPTTLDLEVGYISLDGSVRDLRILAVAAPALSRTTATEFEKGDHDPIGGLWIARAVDRPDIPVAILRACDYRALKVPPCHLTVTPISGSAADSVVQVTTDVYAHAVHLAVPDGGVPEDDYFDLLPGEAREIRIAGLTDPGGVRVSAVNQGQP